MGHIYRMAGMVRRFCDAERVNGDSCINVQYQKGTEEYGAGVYDLLCDGGRLWSDSAADPAACGSRSFYSHLYGVCGSLFSVPGGIGHF